MHGKHCLTFYLMGFKHMNDNVDSDEIAKFATLAHHWWDPSGDLKTLHQINPLRVEYIKKNVDLESRSVLDIGCGGGILTESLASLGANVTGLDMNLPLIKVAKLHLLESGLKVNYLHTSAEEHAAAHPAQYDIVTCLEMLEHVPDPEAIVKACSALVKPGGHLFFSTINRNPKAYLFAILGAEYILNLIPKNTHHYAKFIRPSELTSWLNNANLQAKEIKGVAYNPFTQTCKLTTDVSVNYLLHAIKQ